MSSKGFRYCSGTVPVPRDWAIVLLCWGEGSGVLDKLRRWEEGRRKKGGREEAEEGKGK